MPERKIRYYEEMASTVSYAPDKAMFRRQADDMRDRLFEQVRDFNAHQPSRH